MDCMGAEVPRAGVDWDNQEGGTGAGRTRLLPTGSPPGLYCGAGGRLPEGPASPSSQLQAEPMKARLLTSPPSLRSSTKVLRWALTIPQVEGWGYLAPMAPCPPRHQESPS